jgi:hypothetical protein
MNEQTDFGRLGRDYMDASAPKKRILIRHHARDPV